MGGGGRIKIAQSGDQISTTEVVTVFISNINQGTGAPTAETMGA